MTFCSRTIYTTRHIHAIYVYIYHVDIDHSDNSSYAISFVDHLFFHLLLVPVLHIAADA